MSYADRMKAATTAALKGSKQVRNRELINPHRDWGFGLLAAVLLFVVVSAWSTRLYLEYRTLSLEVPTTNTTRAVVYRDSRVAAALDYFSERANRLTTLREDGPSTQLLLVPEAAATATGTPTSTPAQTVTVATTTVSSTTSVESSSATDNPAALMATSTPTPQPFLE